MTIFTGTSGNDMADAVMGTLIGFAGGTIAELQDANGDIFIGAGGGDMIIAGPGADRFDGDSANGEFHGRAGDDTFDYSIGTSGISGDLIDGGDGSDTLLLPPTLADFSSATIVSTGASSVDRILFRAGSSRISFDAAQIAPTGVSPQLLVEGNADGEDWLTVAITQNGGSVDLSQFTFANWDPTTDRLIINDGAGDDLIVGTSTGDSIFESPVGSTGNDEAFAGAGDDQIYGRSGSDVLHGEAGNDTFFYATESEIEGDTIDGGADAGGNADTLFFTLITPADLRNVIFSSTGTTSIEHLQLSGAAVHDYRFSAAQVGPTGLSPNLLITGPFYPFTIAFDDAASLDLSGFRFETWNERLSKIVVRGTVSADTVIGSLAIDSISGDAGADALSGGGGADLLFGGPDSDQLNGESGLDFIDGGIGADWMDGGADFDTASWLTETNGVVVNLNNQAQNAGAAVGDRLSNFENYYLANANDSFTGDANGGYVYGFDGSDTITGGAGVDIVDGGSGGDVLNGGDNFDYASWNSSTIGVTVNLNNQAQNAGGAAGDTINNFEAYFLSEHADNFTGVDNGASIIFGFGGADTLSDGTGSNAWLFGGTGADILTGGSLNDLLSGGAGADIYHYATWVGEGFDSILDFVSGSDKFRFTASSFGFTAGASLNPTNFVVASAPVANSATPTFLYSNVFGFLSFDLDGTGTTYSAVALAQIASAPNVAPGDFLFV